MKRLTLALIVMSLATGLVFAKRILWDPRKPPRLPLPDAYGLAVKALGSATNRYHCVSADCFISRSPDGEWFFTFHDTNGASKSVFVFFDKTTQVEDGRVVF